jgi:long-chain acyl-CoA synthetase
VSLIDAMKGRLGIGVQGSGGRALPGELGAHVRVQTVAEEARSIGDMFRLRARRSASRPSCFYKRDGRWQRMSWTELYDQARRVAHAFHEMGLAPGEVISVLGPTSVPWAAYDLGAQLLGLCSVGIYPHQSVDQVHYLLQHSESRVVLVDSEEELQTVLQAARGVESLRAIVPWDKALFERHAGDDPRLLSPDHFAAKLLDEEIIDARLSRIDPEATAMLVYTSGTTGPPKGAMISHRNVLSLLRAEGNNIDYFEDDITLSFLPMAHVAERNLGFYGRINSGMAAAYASSIARLLDELKEVQPTVFGSVPRIFEKAYGRVKGEVARKPAAVQKLFAWAEQTGKQRVRHELDGEPLPLTVELQHNLADLVVFRKVREAFGGRVRAMFTGAAPIPRDVLEFFWAAGLPVYEVYGMTEATVTTHGNRPGQTRLGTVGRVGQGMQCRLAEDGEVLVRGPRVFQGYFKDPAATAETIDSEGWLHTGDIGTVDTDGFLRITDRKKHLIITAGGKNIAPANIERALKVQSPLISQVHAHGDRRPYVSAIIAPSPLETLEWGSAHGLVTGADLEARKAELLANPAARSPALNQAMARVVADSRFRQAFLEPVKRGNRDLSRVEQVRRFVVLDRDFSQEEGELTPTMKLKRKTVEQKYAPLLDRIYAEEGFALDAGGGDF